MGNLNRPPDESEELKPGESDSPKEGAKLPPTDAGSIKPPWWTVTTADKEEQDKVTARLILGDYIRSEGYINPK